MALVKFSPLVSGASGKVGGVVFSKTVGGHAVRSWSKGTNPRTSKQESQRSRLSMLSTTYGQLTPAQRQSFTDAANLAEHKVTNRLGEATNLTGPQFYNKVNLLLLAAGLPIISSYSGYWQAPLFSGTLGAYDVTDPEAPTLDFNLQYEAGWDPNAADHVWCVKISRPTPPGRKPTVFRNLGAYSVLDTGVVTVTGQNVAFNIPTADIIAAVAEQPEGYRYCIKVMALSPDFPWDQSVETIGEGQIIA